MKRLLVINLEPFKSEQALKPGICNRPRLKSVALSAFEDDLLKMLIPEEDEKVTTFYHKDCTSFALLK